MQSNFSNSVRWKNMVQPKIAPCILFLYWRLTTSLPGAKVVLMSEWSVFSTWLQNEKLYQEWEKLILQLSLAANI